MLLPAPIEYETGVAATWAAPLIATINFQTGTVQGIFGFWLNEAAHSAGKVPLDRRPFEVSVAEAEAAIGAPLDLSAPLLAVLAAQMAQPA